MEEATGILDDAKREKALYKVMELGCRDQNFIPLHNQFTVMATRKGFVFTPRTSELTLAMDAKPAP